MSVSKTAARIAGLSAAIVLAQSSATPALADSCFDRLVRPVIAQTLGVKEKRVDRGAPLRELGAGRRDRMEIAARLEDAVGYRISGGEARYWEYVGDVENTVCSRRRY